MTEMLQGASDPNDDQVSQDMQGAMNDASQQAADTPVDPMQSKPDGPPPAPAPEPSMWKQVLVGALNGLAGAAGTKNFASGLAGGAQGEMNAVQLQKSNQIKQQQAQSLAQFRDAHAANYASDAALKDAKRAALPQQLQDSMDKAGQATIDRYTKMNIKPLRTIENTPEAANAAMEDIAKTTPDGKLPPVYTAHFKGADGKEMIAVYDMDSIGSTNGEAMRSLINNAAPIFGVPKISSEAFAALSKTQQNKMFANQANLLNPTPETDGSKLQGQIENYKAYVRNAKAAGSDDETVTGLNQALSRLQAASDHSQQQKMDLAKQRGTANQDAKVLPVTKANGSQGFDRAGDAVKNGDVPANQSPDRWLPNATSNEKMKAELSENIAKNSNDVKEALARRPELVGAISGRFTQAKQMIGNNDPDIAAIGQAVQNIAKSNNGVHGMRSEEAALNTERMILNNFKNGPKAVAGALDANVGSVQTFIDDARPKTYATHSANGGAYAAFPHTKYAQAPGQPRMKSTDGGKTWQKAQQ